ncbi:DUF799 domain-containing protein [Nitrincola sp. MINF-07-Sa-05]|uniref:DUF799 domain-containing protein n=1 Tax=Nitrincola salilacus TaxID=3400273 RepID=UPI00391836A8
MSKTIGAILLLSALFLTGCATTEPYDYTAFKQHQPKSILVLPPVNVSPDVKASQSVLSYVSYPLAESGYYVLPVGVVLETFKQNGLVNPEEIREVSLQRLHEIFGADAVLYIDVLQYGTSYIVVSSDTRVTARAELIDLKTGTSLWSGEATASSTEQRSSGGGLIGMLVQAVVEQVANTLTERSHQIAGITTGRLLWPNHHNGILVGHRSPAYIVE